MAAIVPPARKSAAAQRALRFLLYRQRCVDVLIKNITLFFAACSDKRKIVLIAFELAKRLRGFHQFQVRSFFSDQADHRIVRKTVVRSIAGLISN